MYLHKVKAHMTQHSYPLEEGFEHVGESLALTDPVLRRGRQSRVPGGRLRAGH